MVVSTYPLPPSFRALSCKGILLEVVPSANLLKPREERLHAIGMIRVKDFKEFVKCSARKKLKYLRKKQKNV